MEENLFIILKCFDQRAAVKTPLTNLINYFNGALFLEVTDIAFAVKDLNLTAVEFIIEDDVGWEGIAVNTIGIGLMFKDCLISLIVENMGFHLRLTK